MQILPDIERLSHFAPKEIKDNIVSASFAMLLGEVQTDKVQAWDGYKGVK